MIKKSIATIAIILSICATTAHAEWSVEQQSIIDQMTLLWESTRDGGGGRDSYAAVLAPDFTRWTVGSELINDRAAWIAGVGEWFEAGGRVLDGSNNVLEISILGNAASVRRIVREDLLNPDGSQQSFQTGIVETWIRSDRQGGWLLLRSSVKPEPVSSQE